MFSCQLKHQQLNRRCVQSIKTGNAEGTRANRRTHARAYQRFCSDFNFDPYPANSWRLVQFAQYLFDEDKRPGTVANYVSSIRILHKLAEMPCPDSAQIHFTMMMNGFKRMETRPVKQADPVDHEILLRLFTKVNLAKELEAVAWTAVLTGFNLVLRVSNLGPVSRKKFDPLKHPVRGDFQIKDGYPALGIRWSKTNQYRNRINWAPIMAVKHREINPNWWIQRMIQLIPAQDSEPLFLVREGNNRFPLTSSQIRRLLKEWCIACTIEPRTPHALRRGGLNLGHKSQLSGEYLKVLGDWSSLAYHKYLDVDYRTRLESTKRMEKFVNKM